jgi:phytol kinase
MLSNNLLALIITLCIALIWLRLNDYAAQRKWISSQLSRNIIHIGTGPLFVLCWILFPDESLSRFLAALVPALITIQFILVGTGIIHDQAAVDAMSRTGNRREILQGPLYYGLIFILITVIYWRRTSIGITALMLMCGGDGLADILGRRFGGAKLQWNKTKSWAGTAGMFIGGFVCALIVLQIYISFGMISGDITGYILPLLLVALIGSIVESLPIANLDNITITISALIAGHVLL